MRSILAIYLISIFTTEASFGISNCETLIREAASENILTSHINPKNLLVKFPTKINWTQVDFILKNQKLGTPATRQWIEEFYIRNSKGLTTFEEELAFIQILNPERGAPLLNKAKNKDFYVRQQFFGKEYADFGKKQKLFSYKAYGNTVSFPHNVKDFEKYFVTVLNALGPKMPTVFTVIKSEGFRVGNYQKAWIDGHRIVREHKAEVLKLYSDLRKQINSPMTLQEFKTFYKENFGADIKKLEKEGFFNPNLTMEEVLTQLYSKYPEKEASLYVVSLGRSILGMTLTYALFMSDWSTLNEIMNTLFMTLLDFFNPGSAQEENDRTQRENTELKAQKFMDIIVTPALKVQINLIPDNILLDHVDPYDPKILNSSGKTDPDTYPCDPHGLAFKTANDISKQERSARSHEIKDYIRANIFNENCKYVLKLQLIKRQIDEAKQEMSR